jgi:hypothetical protein
MTRFRVLDDAKPLYREPGVGARAFLFVLADRRSKPRSAAALSMRMPRAKCPFLIECCKTQFCPLPGRSHRNAADHHRGTPVHVCLAYSDDQQNERGRAAYAPRRCPSVVRLRRLSRRMSSGGDESPLPPIPSSTLFSVPGEEGGSRWSPRPAALASRTTAGAASEGDRPLEGEAGAPSRRRRGVDEARRRES